MLHRPCAPNSPRRGAVRVPPYRVLLHRPFPLPMRHVAGSLPSLDLSVTLFAVLGSASAFKLALYIYCRALRKNPIMVRRPGRELQGERVWPQRGRDAVRLSVRVLVCSGRGVHEAGGGWRMGYGLHAWRLRRGLGCGCVRGLVQGACTAVRGASRGSMPQQGRG